MKLKPKLLQYERRRKKPPRNKPWGKKKRAYERHGGRTRPRCFKEGCEHLASPTGYCSKHRDYSLSRRYQSGQKRAKKQGLPFELSFETWCDLVVGQSCSYCGAGLPPTGFGLDRIDSRLGYTFSNVTTCCASCNELKSDRLTSQETKNLVDFLKQMRNTDTIWGNNPKRRK